MGELVWGTPLFFDLWAAGMAGGAFFAAFMLKLLGTDKESRLLKLATYIGVPLVLLGVVAIVLDLGEPFRAFNMYIGLRPLAWSVLPASGAAAMRFWPPSLTLFPVSPMSLGGWVLVLFSVAGIVLIVLWLAEKRRAESKAPIASAVKVVSWIAFVVAIVVMTYTGVVLAASSQALWSTTLLLPAVFVTSAISTGVAALIIVGRLAKTGAVLDLLEGSLGTLLTVQLVVTVLFIIWLVGAGLAGPLVGGSQGPIFWLGAILVGLIVPLILEYGAGKGGALGSAMWSWVSPILILVGGFALRAAVVVAGQL